MEHLLPECSICPFGTKSLTAKALPTNLPTRLFCFWQMCLLGSAYFASGGGTAGAGRVEPWSLFFLIGGGGENTIRMLWDSPCSFAAMSADSNGENTKRSAFVMV